MYLPSYLPTLGIYLPTYRITRYIRLFTYPTCTHTLRIPYRQLIFYLTDRPTTNSSITIAHMNVTLSTTNGNYRSRGILSVDRVRSPNH